jgi:hypothetical protein
LVVVVVALTMELVVRLEVLVGAVLLVAVVVDQELRDRALAVAKVER